MTPTLNEDFLLDDFHESGSRQGDFEELLRSIDAQTKCGKYMLKNLTLFSLDEKQPDPSAVYGCIISPQSPLVYRKAMIKGGTITVPSVDRGYLPMEYMTRTGNFIPLLREAMATNRVMLYNRELSGDKMMGVFMSKLAMKTLAQRLGLKVGPLERHSLERDLFLASLMDQETEITIITKRFNNMSKVFAVLGSEFANINLFMICELYSLAQEEKRFGIMECVGWDVTHKRAKITFRLPDLADCVEKKYGLKEPMMPYVEYVSSDTGEQSLQVRIFWITKSGNFIPGSVYQRRHRGHFENLEKFKLEIDRTVFDQLEHVPVLLHKLMSIRISPDGYMPDSSRWTGRNHHRVFRALKYIVKAIGVSAVIGKKRQVRLNKIFDYGLIKDEAIYTAYDVLMDICAIPALIKELTNDPKLFTKEEKELPAIGEETERKLKEYCIASALELDFEKVRKYVIKEIPADKMDPEETEIIPADTEALPGDSEQADTHKEEATA